MRAITLWQPWADAVIFLGKNVENRPRSLGYTGEIAIHVGLNANPDFAADLGRVADAMAKSAHASAAVYRNNPLTMAIMMKRRRGYIIGVVDIVLWRRSIEKEPSSPWEFGPWCAVLRNPRPIARPVPARGYQGTWTVPEDVERRVRAQLEPAKACDCPGCKADVGCYRGKAPR